MIFGLTEFMRERSPFKVRAFTAAHNLLLCILSLGMYLVGAIATYELIEKHGWTGLYYVPPKDCKGLFQWAIYLFYLSKFYEFIDTAILALKKVALIDIEIHHFLARLSSCHRSSMCMDLVRNSNSYGTDSFVVEYCCACFDVLVLLCKQPWLECVVQKVHYYYANSTICMQFPNVFARILSSPNEGLSQLVITFVQSFHQSFLFWTIFKLLL
jgi:hypothetical protein